MDTRRPALWLSLNLALSGAVLFSALAVVDVTHRCRNLYADLQRLQAAQWDAQEQWGRLLLEESTWAAHHRVEQIARRQLGMRLPEPAELEVVSP